MFQNPTYGDASEFMRFEEVSYVHVTLLQVPLALCMSACGIPYWAILANLISWLGLSGWWNGETGHVNAGWGSVGSYLLLICS